jgi:hypothetical protein
MSAEPLAIHRSKRSQIKLILRQYEQGRLTEARAIDDILKVTQTTN